MKKKTLPPEFYYLFFKYIFFLQYVNLFNHLPILLITGNDNYNSIPNIII